MATRQTREPVYLAMQELIRKEHEDGCCMADESLIDPAIRRWRSYDRRIKKNKHKSFEHRAHDLEKSLFGLFPNLNYDPACLRHLAKSFAEILAKFEIESQLPPTSDTS